MLVLATAPTKGHINLLITIMKKYYAKINIIEIIKINNNNYLTYF